MLAADDENRARNADARRDDTNRTRTADTNKDDTSKTRFAANEGDRNRSSVTRLDGAVDRARRAGTSNRDPIPTDLEDYDEASPGFWRRFTSSDWLPWGLGIAALLALLLLLFRSEREEVTVVQKQRPDRAPAAQRPDAAESRRPNGSNGHSSRPASPPPTVAPTVAPKSDAPVAKASDTPPRTSDSRIPSIDQESTTLAAEALAALKAESLRDTPADNPLAGGRKGEPLSISSIEGGIAGGPRVQSLRLGADEVSSSGEAKIKSFLRQDRRVLVEPAPKVEPRSDGGLSLRFYVRGDLENREVNDIIAGCRSRAK